MNNIRHGVLRRQVNSLWMRDGELQESKVFSTVGKGLIVWLIYHHVDDLIDHYEVMLVLFAFLILPDVVKKIITMKLGSQTEVKHNGGE